MNINKNEVLRYLGYKNQPIDENLNELIDSCIDEIKEISDPRYICNIFDVKVFENEVQLSNTNLTLRGRDITNHLRNSKKCAVLASTLGVKVDNRIGYLERVDMTRALILDACATEAIESICNEVEDGIREPARKEGLDINYRYSPGYGDLPIDVQPHILNVLNAEKK
ncbi:methionine synthase [Fonticella tunisiensis]|uniref:Cobalamin-dependent methionine synthase-like protein n=1 Tax=Fonticella tunisiensis TaxID=1096341 RepID=A0A4R7KQU0_9CLOT|nr:methionine synthase [Fonticella tunisiensis]TDT61054.1 hypothetical protein EDD71_10967 [Fonticella tunisiensis]